ncbi:MAG: metallophosphoesterase [Deltaproteobacteria bacterium]|nr:metallophosphoesterase [Deltaproteobacteria bacterium]MBW2659070.1 metallophosphoesterase [Deltaproteobacteria bacterium]
MNILIVADTVTEKLLDQNKGGPFLQDISLILSCGDLPPEYLSSLTFRYDVPLLFILGNHDLRYTSSPPAACRNIHQQLVSFDNLKIVGFSGSRWYNGGVNQYTESQMSRFIAKMRFTLWRNGTPDLILSHAPPRHINDAEDLCHRGFRGFRKFIDKYSPPYFLHGHIHTLFKNNSERITTVNSTQVINCYGFYVLKI